MFLQAIANGIMTLGLLQQLTLAEIMLIELHLGLLMQTPPEIGYGQKTCQQRGPMDIVTNITLQWTSLATILYSSHM